MRRWLALLALLLPAVATAQTTPGPPGPFVFDLRGAMVGVPKSVDFYPELPSSVSVPGRGFGVDVGGHVYPWQLGHARVGLGVNVVMVRGKVGPPDVSARLSAVAPQVTFNFGNHDGWSYLGAGYGLGSVSTRLSGSPDTTAKTGQVGAINFGGGARWFVNEHVATTFDVRFYRLSASSEAGTPATMNVGLSVGVSLR